MKRPVDPRLPRLAEVADLVHQNDLARLAREMAALESARAGLRALEPLAVDPSDPSRIQAQLLHQKWAATCRKRIEAEVERSEKTILQLREKAARSFARSSVLTAMGRKPPPDHPS